MYTIHDKMAHAYQLNAGFATDLLSCRFPTYKFARLRSSIYLRSCAYYSFLKRQILITYSRFAPLNVDGILSKSVSQFINEEADNLTKLPISVCARSEG